MIQIPYKSVKRGSKIGLVPEPYMNWFLTNPNYILRSSVSAHDVIAHTVGDTGTFIQELRALGVEGWLFDSFRDVSVNPSRVIEAELAIHLRLYFHQFGKLPRLGHVKVVEEDAFFSDMLSGVSPYEVANQLWQGSPEKADIENLPYPAPDRTKVIAWVKQNLPRLKKYLLRGFHYAKTERYKGYTASQVKTVRRGIEYLPYMDVEGLNPETRVILNFSLETGKVFTKLERPEGQKPTNDKGEVL